MSKEATKDSQLVKEFFAAYLDAVEDAEAQTAFTVLENGELMSLGGNFEDFPNKQGYLLLKCNTFPEFEEHGDRYKFMNEVLLLIAEEHSDSSIWVSTEFMDDGNDNIKLYEVFSI